MLWLCPTIFSFTNFDCILNVHRFSVRECYDLTYIYLLDSEVDRQINKIYLIYSKVSSAHTQRNTELSILT